MIQETSLQAYEKVLGSLGNRQSIVFQFIKQNGAVSNTQIARGLNWSINRVTGRVKELRSYKMVKAAYKSMGESGVDVFYWQVNEDINDWEPEFKNPRKRKEVIHFDNSSPESYVVQGILF